MSAVNTDIYTYTNNDFNDNDDKRHFADTVNK